VLLTVDLLFVAANMTKLVHGAWLPLLVGVCLFTVMTTWQRGRQITAERERREGSLRAFVDELRSGEARAWIVPGTAVFLNRGEETAPLAMRAVVDDHGYSDDGITRVRTRFGYHEKPDVPRALAGHDPAAGCALAPRRTSCRRSSWCAGTRRRWPAGTGGPSSPRPASPPTTPSTSRCPATALS
jgi:KUP system potassium uptake protein